MRTTMLKRVGFLSLAALALAAIWFPACSHAAQPSQPPPLQASFADAPGDVITSDRQGPYIGGVGGVECYINAGGDLVLDLNKSSRYLNINWPPREVSPYDTCPYPASQPATAPTSSTVGKFLNVNDLGLISSGPTGAFVVTNSAGALHFGTAGRAFCSSQIFVLQGDPTTLNWQIASLSPTYDTAVLVQFIQGQYQPVGYYQMPFSLVVSPKQ